MTTPVQSVKTVKPDSAELIKAPQKSKLRQPEGQLRGLGVKRKLDFDSEPVKHYRLYVESEIHIFTN